MAEGASAFVCTDGRVDMFKFALIFMHQELFAPLHLLAHMYMWICWHVLIARHVSARMCMPGIETRHTSALMESWAHVSACDSGKESCTLFSVSKKQGHQQRLSSRALAAGESPRIDKSSKVSEALFFPGRISCFIFT
jgi:hypothetical protein